MKTVTNIIKISHNLKEFPDIYLEYDLSKKIVQITKIDGDSPETLGFATTLSLTLEETKSIVRVLQHFVELFKCPSEIDLNASAKDRQEDGMIAKLGVLMQPLRRLFSRV